MELMDLTNVTAEEMNKMSIEAVIDENDRIIFDKSNYYDNDGVRYFKKPLKVDYGIFAYNILDCVSLITDAGEYGYVYVFAFSLLPKYNWKIGDIFHKDGMFKNYSVYNGFSSREVYCIDRLS